MMKLRKRMMCMRGMVEMTARDLIMMLLSTRVQLLKVGGRHEREESLGC